MTNENSMTLLNLYYTKLLAYFAGILVMFLFLLEKGNFNYRSFIAFFGILFLLVLTHENLRSIHKEMNKIGINDIVEISPWFSFSMKDDDEKLAISDEFYLVSFILFLISLLILFRII